MKSLKLFIFLFITVFFFRFNAQETNITEDVIRATFIANQMTWLSKDYLSLRKKIILPESINSEISAVRNAYYDLLSKRFDVEKLNGNQPESTLFIYYNFYPDVSGVLSDRNKHFALSEEEIAKNNQLLVDLWKKIPNKIYNETEVITEEIKNRKLLMTIPFRSEIFEDFFEETARKRNDIINFLLWNNKL